MAMASLGHMQVCTSLHTSLHHASTPPLKFFTGRMFFLPPNQQRQSTESTKITINNTINLISNHNSVRVLIEIFFVLSVL